jgi:flagellar assembly factor FliW
MTAVALVDTFRLMHIRSELLGDLHVAEDELVDFQDGIFGFPECRRFVLLQGSKEGTFWLQSVEHSALAFLLVDPFAFVPGYVVDLSSGDLTELQAAPGEQIAILSIVTLPRTRNEQPTANLQGPIAMNMRARVGRQIVIPDSPWGVRQPVALRD